MQTAEPRRTAISLTADELAYLLGLERTPRTANHLGLLGLSVDDDRAVVAGGRSLLARGLATVVDGNLTLSEPIGVIGYLLVRSSTWAQVVLISRVVRESTLVFTADGVSLMVVRREIGVFDLLAFDENASNVLIPLATQFLDESPDAVVAISWMGDDRPDRSVAVVRTEGRRWRVGSDVPPPARLAELAESELIDVAREDALGTLLESARS